MRRWSGRDGQGFAPSGEHFAGRDATLERRRVIREAPGDQGPPSVTTPLVPSTVTTSPSWRRVMTPRTDITAGRPISRAVTAPWDNGPPLSVISPDALENGDVQAGLVVRATRTDPAGKRPKSSAPRTTKQGAVVEPGLPGSPRSTRSPGTGDTSGPACASSSSDHGGVPERAA